MTVQRALPQFETHAPNYAGAAVTVYLAGTNALASLFYDEALTVAATNPQTLLSLNVNGALYGKLAQPVYVGAAIEWEVDGDRSGVMRPAIDDMHGVDASDAHVVPPGSTKQVHLDELIGRFVHAENFGNLSGSTANNTAILNAAIGAVAGAGGGDVLLPPGRISFTSLTLPQNVRLVGQGRGVTTLESQTGAIVVTFGGDRAGLRRLTLDGISLVPGSVGIVANNRAEPVLDDCEVKRFETGIRMRGGTRAPFRDLYITNCVDGAKFHGDAASLDGGVGGEFTGNAWMGGRVGECTNIGVDLSFEDTFARNNQISGVLFEANSGTAMRINGARLTILDGCRWASNTTNLEVRDDDNLARVSDNTIQGLLVFGGSMTGGACTLRDTLNSVAFDNVRLDTVAFTLTTPKQNIVLVDCIENDQTTIAGSGQYLLRSQRTAGGASTGLTSNATATKAWATGELRPGQVVHIEAKILGKQRNGTNTAEYHISASAKRPGASLAYDAQTGNYTVGTVLTGATSGATGRIVADADGGTTGTLTLTDTVGEFIDNEIISDGSGGSATANGSLSYSNAALLGAVTAMRTAREDVVGWDATLVANGPEIEVQVTGAAATVIEWTVDAVMVAT